MLAIPLPFEPTEPYRDMWRPAEKSSGAKGAASHPLAVTDHFASASPLKTNGAIRLPLRLALRSITVPPDNWIAQTVRFLAPGDGVHIKDAMSRDILDAREAAGIEIASGTYDIVGLPPLRVELHDAAARRREHIPAEAG
jgi:hypothetical protein